MAQKSASSEAAPAPPSLKLLEPEVDCHEPWRDDVLDRREIADRLTSIVRGQDVPFVISLDGHWGTGKTFLLKRWQRDLEGQGLTAIYYNAWEDDFASDPLLAITAQLSEYLERGTFASTVRELVRLGAALADLAAPLTPLGHIWVLLRSAFRKLMKRQAPPEGLRRYREGRATTATFRQRLRALGSEVGEETGQPLIFIIDELDRCRPTFAIELLERVKHICDAPGIVFVFGINRREMVKSLESVYGEIDAGTYLRRFFDMELVLAAPDAERFCRHLLKRYRLDAFFSSVSKSRRDDSDFTQFRVMSETLAFIVGTMGLSLRDMDHCVRLLSLAARDVQPGELLHPELLSVLLALKVANQELYRRFVDGTARGADVINYMNTRRGSPEVGTRYRAPVARNTIDRVEEALYCADGGGIVHNVVDALIAGRPLEHRHYLAEHHLRLDPKRDQQQLIQLRGNVLACSRGDYPSALAALARRIDIHDGFVRP